LWVIPGCREGLLQQRLSKETRHNALWKTSRCDCVTGCIDMWTMGNILCFEIRHTATIFFDIVWLIAVVPPCCLGVLSWWMVPSESHQSSFLYR
jgi:hypothetical protein